MNGVKASTSRRIGLCLVMAISLAVPTAAQEAPNPLTALGPFPWGASEEEITERFGPPSFADASFLIYAVVVGDAESDLPLWFSSDKLTYAIYSFPVDSPAEVIKNHFSAISAMLSTAYGKPTSRAGIEDGYATETWILESVDIEHTVILEPNRVDHTAVFAAVEP